MKRHQNGRTRQYHNEESFIYAEFTFIPLKKKVEIHMRQKDGHTV